MTAPYDDDPVVAHERGFRRELVGLVLVLIGTVTLLWVLYEVDPLAAAAAASVAAIASGLWLGRGTDDEGE